MLEEVVAAPYDVWLAVVGTAFPAISANPAGAWFKVGSAGAENYDEDGIVLALSQAMNEWTGAKNTEASKVWRTADAKEVRVPLVDLSPNQFAKVMDDAAVTTVARAAGAAGQKFFDADRGITVAEFALLARGVSSLGEQFTAQLEVKRCYQSADFEIAGKKGEPGKLECVFRTLKPAAAPSVRVRMQSSEPI